MNRPPNAPDGRDEPLSEALRRAASELAGHQPPAAVQAAVRARLAPRWQPAGQLAAARSGRRLGAWAPWTTAALCGALLIASTALLLQPSPGAGRAVADAGWAADPASLGFLPTASAAHWLHGTGADRAAPAWVVSAELPREQLAEFGLPFDPARAADPVRAELLLRGNGEVMAVRVLADVPR